MSSMSSLADVSSGAGEELSFMKNGSAMANQSGAYNKHDSALRHQLFLKTTEAKRWQDSVLHLAGVASGKDEALGWERERSTQLAEALNRAEDAAAARERDVENMRDEHHAALQQAAKVQSEVQSILGTCPRLESHVVQLGA